MCGRSIPSTLHSSGPHLSLKLHRTTGYSGGYDLTYTSSTSEAGMGCGGQVFGTRGVVTSPRYPGNHNVTSDCWWVVQVPQGQTIQLRWDTFNVHRRLEAGGCDGNYVEVVDGLNTGSVRRLIPRLDLYLSIICFDYTNFV